MSIIDPQYTKGLVLELNNGNKISPNDTSLVVVKRDNFSLPLMPNREIKVYNNSGEGAYTNSIFNGNSVNSHMGLSFDNIFTELERTNSFTWSLEFFRDGRDLTKYIEFSYINPTSQQYVTFNFNSQQTIYLYSNSFYMEVNNTSKILTFRRNSLQMLKSSLGDKVSSVVLRMRFKVPTKMIIQEHSFASSVEYNFSIYDLVGSKHLYVDNGDTTLVYRSIPLDPKLIRVTSYEDVGNKSIEEYCYDNSGILDIFKDSSRKNTGNNLHTSEPRWRLLKDGDNTDLLSYSEYNTNPTINPIFSLNFESSSGSLGVNIESAQGGSLRMALCGIVMILPETGEYPNLPSNNPSVGTVNYYIKNATETFLLYSYTFNKQHKIGSIPYIKLLSVSEYLTLKLNDTTPVNRDYNLIVGNSYNFYITAPYSITLNHNNRNGVSTLRVLNGVLPSVTTRTKKVGGSNANFLGYWSSSNGGTMYIDSNYQWVVTPSPGQTLYARWGRGLYFSVPAQKVDKGLNTIEATRSFVPDSIPISQSNNIYWWSSPGNTYGASVLINQVESVNLSSNKSITEPDTYYLSGGYSWVAQQNRLFIKANVISTLTDMNISNSGAPYVLGTGLVSCNSTRDETNGYVPAKNSIFNARISGSYFMMSVDNPNSYNVKVTYIIYKSEGTVEKTQSKVVPPGVSNLESYTVASGYKYKVIINQEWESSAGTNAGRDSSYETTIQSHNFSVVSTATPTVDTPYCQSTTDQYGSESKYLKVYVYNNDSSPAVIKNGPFNLGTVPGKTGAYLNLQSGFNTPYNYSYTITATATDKTQSAGVSGSGTVNICRGGF